ncbi:MAG: hypothetical protein EPN91_08160 [Salinibacterium sp.]|nr:MAG: hypothetical protein EPN91_08160 [Salinibacterium sp.]
MRELMYIFSVALGLLTGTVVGGIALRIIEMFARTTIAYDVYAPVCVLTAMGFSIIFPVVYATHLERVK